MKKISVNELLLSLYLILFPSFSYFFKSQVLNYVFICAIIIAFIFNSLLTNKRNTEINIITLSLFAFTFVFYNNDMLIDYLGKYIIYGFLTMLLFSKVENYDKVIHYSAFLHLILFIISIMDPFNNYKIYQGYMSFGLFCALPCFLLFHIEENYYKNKKYIIPEIISILLLFYSNRNTILIAIVFVLIFDLVTKKRSLKKMVKYSLLLIFTSIIIMNAESILNYISKKFQLNTYAITAILQWFHGETTGLAGRDIIWDRAINVFTSHPIFGIGIGGYHARYGVYCHNLFLDILVSTGVLGFILLLIYLFKSIKIYKCLNNKVFFVFIFVIGFLPLMFNNYFMAWKYFWIAIYMVLSYEKKVKGEMKKCEMTI